MAQAKWLRAETAHFRVYGEGSEADLRSYALRLETFDRILHFQHGLKDGSDPPQRLSVYVVKNFGQLARIWPTVTEIIGGFYSAGPAATFAVANRSDDTGLGDSAVLQHEYVHHFMLQNYAYPYASWLLEGYAEYFSDFRAVDNTIEFGSVNKARGYGLMNGTWIPMADLLSKRADQIKGDQQWNFYPQAWLLTHFMLSDPKRRLQLNEYIRRVGKGEKSVPAFTAATGMSADALERALRQYTLTRLNGTRLTLSKPLTFPVTVSTLPTSADDLLLDSVSLQYAANDDGTDGIEPEDSKAEASRKAADYAKLKARWHDRVPEIRARAARHPGDRFAELTLAEAEIRWGDRTQGEAPLERRIKADPSDIDALVLAGESRVLSGAADPARRAALFTEAQDYLGRAYKLDPDRYPMLFAYAQAQAVRPGYPNENDLNVLRLAHQLAPQVDEITLVLAQALAAPKEAAERRQLLTLLASSPHGGRVARRASELLKAAADEKT